MRREARAAAIRTFALVMVPRPRAATRDCQRAAAFHHVVLGPATETVPEAMDALIDACD